MRIILPTLIAALLSSTAAFASSADDAAIAAYNANQEHCASVFARNRSDIAEAIQAVTPVIAQVDTAYKETNADYLLYWRGVLFQCIGQEETATEDLEQFIEVSKDNPLLAQQVRDTRARLIRLGSKKGGGEGPAAKVINGEDHLEIDLRYSAGLGYHSLVCTDDGNPPGSSASNSPVLVGSDPPRVLNAACEFDDGGTSRGSSRQHLRALTFVPASVDLGVFGFLYKTRSFGIGVGARARFDYAAPSPMLDDGSEDNGSISGRSSTPPNTPAHADRMPGPSLVLGIGPSIKIGRGPQSFSRGVDLRIEPMFAIGYGQLSPLAGTTKYFNDQGLIDAGTYGMTNFGGLLSVRVDGEISDKLIFSGGGWGSVFAAQGTAPAEDREVVAPSPTQIIHINRDSSRNIDRTERVELDGGVPDIQRALRYDVGGHIAVLAAVKGKNLAIGPSIDLGWRYSRMDFEDTFDNIWCYRRSEVDGQPDQAWTGTSCGDVYESPYDPDDPQLVMEAAEDINWRKVFSTQRHDLYVRIGIQVRFGAGGGVYE